MNCVASIFKYILYIANILFLVCGILLIVLGSVMLGSMGDVKSFNEAVNTQTIPILMIVLGCIVFIISFFGCCGAIRENACCMSTYAVMMFIVFCLQVALVVWVFVERNDFLNTMGSVVEKAFEENDQARGYPMDAFQVSFKCCGKIGYKDYIDAGKTVPKSCCGSLDATTCPASTYETKPGCKVEFVEFWSSNMDIIRYAGLGVAAIELVAFTVACCLASSMRRTRGHNL